MNLAMVLGLFPGFMSMVAVYFILKALGLSEGGLIRLALILCYSGGAGLGFQIAKGLKAGTNCNKQRISKHFWKI